MNLNFGTTKESVQESGVVPSLTNPFIGPARLKRVEKVTLENKNKDTFPNTLRFVFAVAGEDITGQDVKGREVTYVEFDPTNRAYDSEQKAQEAIAKATGRIGYILSKTLGVKEALIDGSTIKSWEHFCDIVVTRYASSPDFNRKKLTLKVIANEYKGKITVNIPKYKGFLKNEEDTVALAFSSTEEKVNAKYIASKSLKPTDEEDLTGGIQGNLPDIEEDDIF